MKKVITVLSLVGLAGAASIAFANNGSAITPVSAESNNNIVLASFESSNVSIPEGAQKYIPVGDLIPEANRVAGSYIRDMNATYWGGSYGALDSFYDNLDDGAVTSTKTIAWNQYTQYFLFQWGAANDSTDVEIRVYYTTLDDVAISIGDQAYEVIKNNTFCGNTMVLRYHKISDEVWNAHSETGFKVYLDLYDGVAGNGGYAYHLFGNLHANQTFTDIRREINYHYFQFLPTDTRGYLAEFNQDVVRGHYTANSLLAAALNAPVSDISEDFESLEEFNNNWYFDGKYGSGWNYSNLHFDTLIGTDEYRPADLFMPFNKEGNGFFRGWYETSLNQGFVEGDRPIYRFVSAAYTLPSDQAFVSIKMAGTASLHILDGNTHAELAFIDSRVHRYEGDVENQKVYTGFNTCTMTRHVINLSAFAGQTVRFCIADIKDTGWGAVYFDDFNCNVDPNAGLRIDDVVQTTNDATYYSVLRDVYVPSVNSNNGNGVDYKDDSVPAYQITEDTSAFNAAATWVNRYDALARNKENGTSMCAIVESDEMATLINDYAKLSSDVKAIIDASDDYHFEGSSKDNWYTKDYLRLNLGEQVRYISSLIGVDIGNVNLFGGLLKTSTSSMIVVPIVIMSAIIVLIASFIFIKKRKLNSK